VPQQHWPLAHAETAEDLDRYQWPSADWFDYSTIEERCLAAKEADQVTIGGEGSCGIYHAINLRGYERALTDALLHPGLTRDYMERMSDFMVEWNNRWLEAAGGEFELFRCGDEVGNGQSMLLSPEQWRTFYKPHLQRVWAVAKRRGLRTYYHCCGCLRPVFEDLVEIGMDLWDMAPSYVHGNDLAEMKRLYGQQVTFVGGVDQPNVLRAGTPQQVADEVRLRLDQLAPGGGLLLGPSQAITDDCPVENVVTMYETARQYGEY
jgi:uroporphyrinogen decarboxylase